MERIWKEHFVTKKERARLVTEALNREYGTEMITYLHYETSWQLLFATILSAQCTDARVNMVTKDLFQKYPTVEDIANAELSELEKDIYSTGFYKNKAKNLKACAATLLEQYGGEVPHSIEELTALPGVGRKTANVVRGNCFHEPSIVVDTHVKRVSRLLGLTKETDPTKVEFDLMKILPKDQWILYNVQIIAVGRTWCISGRPKCSKCILRDVCAFAEKEIRQEDRV
ncbi:MAG: endonuclease III [Eubacterium sp.]|nr:endonuclease III [Eubacterium sp.]